MILETERLILRQWQETDAEECYKYAKDPQVGPAAGWPAHTSLENTKEVLKNILMVPETFAIVLKETGLPVGSIGLHSHSDLAEAEDEMELGYWIGVPYWGLGIAPEAAREMLRHAFEDLNLNRVWCGFYEGNEKSKRVQEKLGFKYMWTTEAVPVPQMNETRKGTVNRITKEEWTRLWGPKKKDNIILIGMPASGKSSVGVIIAKILGKDFLDVDLVIQQREKALLCNIIAEKGSEGFLKCEEDAILSIKPKNSVIATGGSAVYSEEGMKYLSEIGTVIYLKVGKDVLFRRLKNIKQRGVVLRNGESIDQMYESRKHLYEKYADIVIDEDKRGMEETIAALLESYPVGRKIY